MIALIAAVAGWRRHRRLVAIAAAWFVGAVAVMAITHPLWPHHAVVVSPAYGLAIGAGASSTLVWLRSAMTRNHALAAAAAGAGGCLAAGLFLWSGLSGLQPATDFTGLADALRAHTSASAQLVGDDQYAQALAARQAPPRFVDTSNTRMYAEPGAVQGLEAVSSGAPPVCAVLFSSNRLVNLPGFSAWVSAHYPVTIRLGGARYLHIAPGCS